MINEPGNSYGSGSFSLKVDFGAKISMPARHGQMGYISASAFYSNVKVNVKYTDAAGQAQTETRSISAYGLPLSYTRLTSEDGSGYYWEAGANLGFINSVTGDNPNLIKQYASIYIEPCLSAGLSLHLRVTKSRYGQIKGPGLGQVLFGPFVSYIPTNMSNVDNISLHGYKAGVRVVYIFF
jgi:hypothetical protein